MTSSPLFILILLVFVAVVVIVVRGMANFAKGGSDAAARSNKMMQYRLVAQGVAVGLIVLLGLIYGM